MNFSSERWQAIESRESNPRPVLSQLQTAIAVASNATPLALHGAASWRSYCHFVSSLDADLQRAIAAWDGLPVAIRRATLFSLHSFRVATATDLLLNGIPLEDVQFLLGHADPRTTRLL